MKKYVWVMFILAGLCAYSFVNGVIAMILPEKNSETSLQQEVKSESKRQEGYQLLILGDSISRGAGDVDGLGYPARIVKLLEQEKQSGSVVANLSVNGMTTKEMLQLLQKVSSKHVFEKATTIIFSMGSNDFLRFARNPKGTTFEKVRDEGLKNIKESIKLIRKYNSHAQIICLGMYRPLTDYDNAIPSLLDWNMMLSSYIFSLENVAFVSLMDLFHTQAQEYICPDLIHPNNIGYQNIAMRVFQTLKK